MTLGFNFHLNIICQNKTVLYIYVDSHFGYLIYPSDSSARTHTILHFPIIFWYEIIKQVQKETAWFNSSLSLALGFTTGMKCLSWSDTVKHFLLSKQSQNLPFLAFLYTQLLKFCLTLLLSSAVTTCCFCSSSRGRDGVIMSWSQSICQSHQ